MEELEKVGIHTIKQDEENVSKLFDNVPRLENILKNISNIFDQKEQIFGRGLTILTNL
jgi:hypothetical protein